MTHEFTTERKVEIMKISPAVATKWLERNTKNRPFDRKWATDLAAQMERGEWQDNGESITFSKTGVLLNGQHRLSAIAKSGKTAVCSVQFGVDDAAFATIDRGKKRTLGNILDMDGVIQANLTAAAVGWLWRLHEGALVGRQPSSTQMMEFYETECVGIHDSIVATRHAQNIARGSLVVALHYRFSQLSRMHADEFFALLGDGANMELGHPVLALRDRIFADRTAKAKLPVQELVAMFINSWNAFVSNRPLRVIKGTTDGMIPKIIGPVWTGDAE